MEQRPSWKANNSSVSRGIRRNKWNSGIILPHLQRPATGPCPDSDQSCPHLHPST